MKRFFILLLALICFITGCAANEANKAASPEASTVTVETLAPTEMPEATEEVAMPTAETTPEPTATPAPTEKQEAFVVGDGVNVRDDASMSGKVLTRLALNTEIEVLEEFDGWSYIAYDGDKKGYMSSQYIAESKKEATPTPVPVQTVTPTPTAITKINTSADINDNVFLDALEYTGYNLQKHRDDGMMWVFILGNEKYKYGYLSGLGYDYGNSTGYETNNAGMPDIARFKKYGGLVCASYVTYVYFNYLPNVAKIDTSFLTKPVHPCLAQSWREAAEDWVAKGYSRKLSYSATRNSDGTINFTENEEIPVGSIVVFKKYGASDSAAARHVAIYAGYAGGYHWLTHVGNERGPEMITMERMGFSSTPEVPLEIISTPFSLS